MASSENGNLVQEFEEAFQMSLSALTEEDDLCTKDSETVHQDIEDKISKFTELARHLETFFLQKRFLIYNHKPEMILKEDTQELKAELVRKHYEKLGQWQAMLADVQGVQAGSSGQSSRPPQVVGGAPMPGGPTPQGGFVPSNNYSRMPGPHMFGQQNNLQGPLAYLERTTSSIGS